MAFGLRMEMLICGLLIIFVTLCIVRKGRISIKYSFVWLFSGLIIFFFSIFPYLFEALADLLGFEVLSNMLFSIFIGILIFICMSLTIIISGQSNKIRLLIQEVSTLKKDNDDESK